MKIGYARVSTDEQNLDLQISALRAAGCEVVFEDHGVSGAEFSRPGLDAALAGAKDGDTLVVWRLDRLGRSLGKLIELVERLNRTGIQFQSLTEAICTTSSGGMFIFHMMAALAQFERALISERTRAGMKAARERGRQIGRLPSLTQAEQEEIVERLSAMSATDLAIRYRVHPRTVQRIRKRAAQKKE
ncbi:recombinase family protein [Paraburkholderia sp. Ac-20336]|uniref:recombinase family protein n=1 Tax=Paraburkholderia sp. Ac-20336 TaxID=2703886 RepID=UPI00198120E1|nr:recombinase family protein [Paraburkholderia sp. Ac-20336]MBN3803860.1 recombinase family protein [Paraburkholderia sp. Ac-20336]